jgi:hypothetical protein
MEAVPVALPLAPTTVAEQPLTTTISMAVVREAQRLVPTMEVEQLQTTMTNMVEVSVLQQLVLITAVELPQPITMLMEITSDQVTVLVTIGNREGSSME